MPKALSAGKELYDKFRSEYSWLIKYVHLTLQFKYTYDLNAQQTKLLTTSTVAIYKHKHTIMTDYMSPITHAAEILSKELNWLEMSPTSFKFKYTFSDT